MRMTVTNSIMKGKRKWGKRLWVPKGYHRFLGIYAVKFSLFGLYLYMRQGKS